jgi:sugar/nucleoside kinase (ribokinase family)
VVATVVEPSIGRLAAGPVLLVIGAASRDITAADPRGWRLGGGVTYGALASARLGLRVRALVGVDAATESAAELELLAAAGVELELARLDHGPAMENRETGARREQHVISASEPLGPARLPHRWRSGADALLLAPVAGELRAEWVAQLPRGKLVALAWQGVYRRLVAGRPMIHRPLRPHPLAARADIALVSADDALAGGSPLADMLARDGQQLVISHGARGALHVERRRAGLAARHVPPLGPVPEVDPTGAGDVFLAAWCAALVAAPLERVLLRWPPLAIAAAAASLSVEGSGLAAVPTLAEVYRRLRQLPAGRVSAPDE